MPGATTIHTAELEQLLAERKPIVIDPLLYSWGRSIPGAIGLKERGTRRQHFRRDCRTACVGRCRR